MIQENIQEEAYQDFTIEDAMLKFRYHVYVPPLAEHKEIIIKEAHYTPYTTYPSSTNCIKIYDIISHGIE